MDAGTPKGFRKIWGVKRIGGEWSWKPQSLGQYLSKKMTLWNLDWDAPAGHIFNSIYYSPLSNPLLPGRRAPWVEGRWGSTWVY